MGGVGRRGEGTWKEKGGERMRSRKGKGKMWGKGREGREEMGRKR